MQQEIKKLLMELSTEPELQKHLDELWRADDDRGAAMQAAFEAISGRIDIVLNPEQQKEALVSLMAQAALIDCARRNRALESQEKIGEALAQLGQKMRTEAANGKVMDKETLSGLGLEQL